MEKCIEQMTQFLDTLSFASLLADGQTDVHRTWWLCSCTSATKRTYNNSLDTMIVT